MKFGRQLSELVDPKFRNYCVAYNMLKGFIAETDSKRGRIQQTIQDVTSAAVPFLPQAPAEQLPSVRFQEALNSELEKINRFCELEEDTLLTDLKTVIRRIRSMDGMPGGRLSQVEQVRVELDRIATEICAFSSFIDLNHTGTIANPYVSLFLSIQEDYKEGVQGSQDFELGVVYGQRGACAMYDGGL